MISIAIGDKLKTHTAAVLQRCQSHWVESPELYNVQTLRQITKKSIGIGGKPR